MMDLTLLRKVSYHLLQKTDETRVKANLHGMCRAMGLGYKILMLFQDKREGSFINSTLDNRLLFFVQRGILRR
jgi:hypothetical protein